MGSVVWAYVESDQKLIANAITQEFYGPGDKLYVSYEAIEQCFVKQNEVFLNESNPGSVAMPLIGAGTGGGDWNIISDIIERTSTHFQPVVYRHD